VLIDAIVLAGGRSSRLGEVPKRDLRFEQHTLLEHAVAAVSFARATVVVGDVGTSMLAAAVLLTRESPPFAGPAAGIAAGIEALASAVPSTPSDYTMVIACDMPLAAAATGALHRALRSELPTDGLIAVDDQQRRQPLAALYNTASLTTTIAEHHQRHTLSNLSVFRLIDGLTLTPIAVPAGSTDDVDNWDDAARFGITKPEPHPNPESGENHDHVE